MCERDWSKWTSEEKSLFKRHHHYSTPALTPQERAELHEIELRIFSGPLSEKDLSRGHEILDNACHGIFGRSQAA